MRAGFRRRASGFSRRDSVTWIHKTTQAAARGSPRDKSCGGPAHRVRKLLKSFARDYQMFAQWRLARVHIAESPGCDRTAGQTRVLAAAARAATGNCWCRQRDSASGNGARRRVVIESRSGKSDCHRQHEGLQVRRRRDASPRARLSECAGLANTPPAYGGGPVAPWLPRSRPTCADAATDRKHQHGEKTRRLLQR